MNFENKRFLKILLQENNPSGKETILMITDSCPSCHLPGDLDLSLAAWNTFSGNEGPSRYEGTWEFIECPKNFVDGPARLRVKVKCLIRFKTLKK